MIPNSDDTWNKIFALMVAGGVAAEGGMTLGWQVGFARGIAAFAFCCILSIGVFRMGWR